MRRQLLTITVIALAGVLMLAGCKRKEIDTLNTGSHLVFTATTSDNGDDGGKTTLTPYGGTLWTSGDKINIYDNDSTTAVYVLSDGANTNEGTFEFYYGTPLTGSAFTAAYPSDMVSTMASKSVTFTLPATQELVANSFGNGAAPMVAYSESGSTEFSFYNACAGICIPMIGSDDNICVSQITVTASDYDITGSYTVSGFDSDTAPTSIVAVSGGGRVITLSSD